MSQSLLRIAYTKNSFANYLKFKLNLVFYILSGKQSQWTKAYGQNVIKRRDSIFPNFEIVGQLIKNIINADSNHHYNSSKKNVIYHDTYIN